MLSHRTNTAACFLAEVAEVSQNISGAKVEQAFRQAVRMTTRRANGIAFVSAVSPLPHGINPAQADVRRCTSAAEAAQIQAGHLLRHNGLPCLN